MSRRRENVRVNWDLKNKMWGADGREEDSESEAEKVEVGGEGDDEMDDAGERCHTHVLNTLLALQTITAKK